MDVVLEIVVAVAALLAIAWLYQRLRRNRPDTGDTPGDPGELVVLRTSYSPGETDVIRGLLEASGVPAVVSTDSADGWRPEALWRPSRVLVRAADAEHARALLAEALEEETPQGASDTP